MKKISIKQVLFLALSLSLLLAMANKNIEKAPPVGQQSVPVQSSDHIATASGLSAKMLRIIPAEDINGKAIDRNKKIYMVDVWATWCPPCRLTIPEFIKLKEELATESFEIVALSVDRDPRTVIDFLLNNPVNYPVAMAGSRLDYLPAVRGIPTLFVMNAHGDILATAVGYKPKDELLKIIRPHL